LRQLEFGDEGAQGFVITAAAQKDTAKAARRQAKR